jgi:hypothetical protein
MYGKTLIVNHQQTFQHPTFPQTTFVEEIVVSHLKCCKYSPYPVRPRGEEQEVGVRVQLCLETADSAL